MKTIIIGNGISICLIPPRQTLITGCKWLSAIIEHFNKEKEVMELEDSKNWRPSKGDLVEMSFAGKIWWVARYVSLDTKHSSSYKHYVRLRGKVVKCPHVRPKYEIEDTENVYKNWTPAEGDEVEVSNNNKFWLKVKYAYTCVKPNRYRYAGYPNGLVDKLRGYRFMRPLEEVATSVPEWQPENGEEVIASNTGTHWSDAIYIGKNTSEEFKWKFPHVISNALGAVIMCTRVKPKREVVTKEEAEKRLNVRIEG